MLPVIKKFTDVMPSTTQPLFSNVHGVAFAPTKMARQKYHQKGYTVFLGKEKWQAAGAPENAIVYDFVDALISMNMPLLDTVRTKTGLFMRKDPLFEPKPYEATKLYPGRVNDTGEISVLSLKDPTLEIIPNRVSVIREDVVARKGSIARGVAKRSKPGEQPKEK